MLVNSLVIKSKKTKINDKLLQNTYLSVEFH